MASSGKKSAKLKFKGEKREKKHHKKRRLDGADSQTQVEGDNDASESVQGWLNPPTQAHISGPVFLISITPCHGSGGPSGPVELEAPKPCAVAIFPTPVSPLAPVRPALLSSQALETLDPDDVNQVWVCTRVVDSDDRVTLRAANGRYLACDQLGSVSAEREARSTQEEWAFEPITPSAPDEPRNPSDGLFSLRSILYQKILTVEEVSGGKLEVRCDADSVDSSAHLLVRMQSSELVKSKKRLTDQLAQKGLSAQDSTNTGITILPSTKAIADLEKNNIRQYQARGAGRLVTPDEPSSSSALKKAQKEGRLAEELLDRRSKLKSDRYAK